MILINLLTELRITEARETKTGSVKARVIYYLFKENNFSYTNGDS